MSGKEIISRLKVPSLSFIDKTPTPRVTPLLRAVDAIGLFREDEKLSAVSTSSSNNPFDETFRKALKENSSSNQVDHAVDDVLNTPQIISFPPSAPPSANVLCYSNKTSIGSVQLQFTVMTSLYMCMKLNMMKLKADLFLFF